jgi:hypothetical protein
LPDTSLSDDGLPKHAMGKQAMRENVNRVAIPRHQGSPTRAPRACIQRMRKRLLPLCLALTACASFAPDKKLAPAAAPNPEVPSARVGNLLLWANTAMFWGAPSDVEGWVAPVGLDIINESEAPTELRLEDMRLVDDKGRSAAPFFLPKVVSYPIDVERLRAGARENPPLMTTATVAFAKDSRRAGPLGGADWRDETGLPTAPPRTWVEKVRFVGAPPVVALSALSDRPIAGRSRLSGYVYFPRPYPDATKAWLVWKVGGGANEVRIPFELR